MSLCWAILVYGRSKLISSSILVAICQPRHHDVCVKLPHLSNGLEAQSETTTYSNKANPRSGRTILWTPDRYRWSLISTTSSGFSYILTIMDTVTRFPEAVCPRWSTSKAISQALLKIFTQFGLPLWIRSGHSVLLDVKHYEVYLATGSYSFLIKVFTDHNSLAFVRRMKTENQRSLRWSLKEI